MAVVRLADITVAAPAASRLDSERTPRSQVPSVLQVLTQGLLNNRGEWRRRFLGADVAFHGLSQVIRNGYGVTLHPTILAPIGKNGERACVPSANLTPTPSV